LRLPLCLSPESAPRSYHPFLTRRSSDPKPGCLARISLTGTAASLHAGPSMWEWLLWGHPPKPRAKQLGDVVERLLAAGPADGENAFPLPEKELKRLCSATRWAGASGSTSSNRMQHSSGNDTPLFLLLPARDALLKEPTLLDVSTAGNVVVVGARLHCDTWLLQTLAVAPWL